MPAIDFAFLRRNRLLVGVTVLQALCAAYFVFDVLGELDEYRDHPWHPLIEGSAVLVLATGTAFGVRELTRLLRRNARLEGGLRAARGAFAELLVESFDQWRLTPSERDVALLAIKGVPVAQIAALRETRVGTVKAQCSAIYRKAGVSNRAELLSHYIEELLSGEPLGPAA
jgi:DNA-binding NarL/FixJ family response regulator